MEGRIPLRPRAKGIEPFFPIRGDPRTEIGVQAFFFWKTGTHPRRQESFPRRHHSANLCERLGGSNRGCGADIADVTLCVSKEVAQPTPRIQRRIEMVLSDGEKEDLKRELGRCFHADPSVEKVVVFGSFLRSSSPNDLDVAVFGDRSEPYLPLALEYRKRTRSVARRIPVDIFPVRKENLHGTFLKEIQDGEVIYER
jgi:predicted nucleotidyltransferase